LNRSHGLLPDLLLKPQNLFAPRLAAALRTFINGGSNTETVVAGSAIVAGKLVALRARIKRAGFGQAMFIIKQIFTGKTHYVIPRIAGIGGDCAGTAGFLLLRVMIVGK